MKKEVFTKFYVNYKLFIFPMTVALSSLFLIVFAIYPQTAKLINNQMKTGDLIKKSKILETKVVALESYDDEDLTRKVGFALAAFPADKDFGNILGLLQQLAMRSGFKISSITLGNTRNKLGNSDSFEIKLEVNGSRNMFPTLLSSLENSSRLIRINTIDVSLSKASQTLDASLMVGVLYSLLPQNFGTADSPLPEFSQKEEELIATLARVTEKVSSPSGTPSSPRGKSNPFD